jgi:hypothetical protein
MGIANIPAFGIEIFESIPQIEAKFVLKQLQL